MCLPKRPGVVFWSGFVDITFLEDDLDTAGDVLPEAEEEEEEEVIVGTLFVSSGAMGCGILLLVEP